MSGSHQLIAQLTGKLLDDLGGNVRKDTIKGKLPPKIEKRVRSYNSFENVWSNADSDILALLAMAEIMRDETIDPFKSKNEEQIQIEYGVNALSRAAMEKALANLRETRDALRSMKLHCEAMRPLADVLAARALLGGVTNASQLAFNKLGAERVKKTCQGNEKASKLILPRFDVVIEVNEKVLDMHRTP